MEIELEVSEIEDYSEFPNQDIKTVEITSKNKQETQQGKEISLASEVRKEDKSTQTLSRRVWRKIRRKEKLKQQDAYQTSSTSSNRSNSCRNAVVLSRIESLWRTTGTRFSKTRRRKRKRWKKRKKQ